MLVPGFSKYQLSPSNYLFKVSKKEIQCETDPKWVPPQPNQNLLCWPEVYWTALKRTSGSRNVHGHQGQGAKDNEGHRRVLPAQAPDAVAGVTFHLSESDQIYSTWTTFVQAWDFLCAKGTPSSHPPRTGVQRPQRMTWPQGSSDGVTPCPLSSPPVLSAGPHWALHLLRHLVLHRQNSTGRHLLDHIWSSSHKQSPCWCPESCL